MSVALLAGCGGDSSDKGRSLAKENEAAKTRRETRQVKERSQVDLTPRPPELDAALDAREPDPIERGYEPAVCDEKSYEVHEMEGYGKFYVEPGTRDAIKMQLLEGVVWEPHLQPLFETYVKPGSTVIDVGAHIGTHTVKLAELVGPEGHVIAFEPQQKMFDELRCNLALNGVKNTTALAVALGDAFGKIEMDAPNPLNEGGIGPGQGGNEAELRPLDSYALEDLSVLKIDVEGFEDHVIEGARRTIEKHKPVIFVEIQGGHNWDKAPPEIREKIASTAHKLTSMGYRVDRVGVFDYLAQVQGSPAPPQAAGKPAGGKPPPAPGAGER